MGKNIFFFIVILLLSIQCSKDDNPVDIIPDPSKDQNLTIFFVNDQHGQLDNFSKIKYIVDLEKQERGVIVACSGDMFSGNPIVDNHEEKGFPMIDMMNQAGFDISVLGNHEFDYGESALKDRMEQANFDWVCANVDMGETGIPEPLEYKTITIDTLKITFLGLVETNGKPNGTIPSTHPWKVQNLHFERPENVVDQFKDIKEQEGSDLYVALTHIGHSGFGSVLGDFELAEQFPYFDLIIGGHTNQLLDTIVNSTPVFQAGNYLNYLGKITMSVKNKKVDSYEFDLINLNTYPDFDEGLNTTIDAYNSSMPELQDVIGFSHTHHFKFNVGCFYTDALSMAMEVDISLQNSGGIRATLDEGDITKAEIYEISPFNNGTIIYNRTVGEFKTFLIETGKGFNYSGLDLDKEGNDIIIKDQMGNVLADSVNITLGLPDYIPAIHDSYFSDEGATQSLTAAETIIYYLENINSDVNYPSCNRFFRF
jgi:2',3'-cyclic-nucleotide 2'-phosphodiesterase (5'-nucleotidase family)